MRRIRVRHLAVLLAAAVLLPPSSARAQTESRSGFTPPAGSNLVTVIANDFAFVLPDTIPAGLTTIRLLDQGKFDHHLSLVRLDSGKTASQAMKALIAAGMGVRPAWMHPVGGPNGIKGGTEQVETLVLAPGNYLAFCEMPGPDPAPHYTKGMMKALTVAGPARSGALPKADLMVTLTDYKFAFSHPVTAGHHVIAVANAGPQPHMFVIVRYHPGANAKAFLDWAYDPAGKPAPGDSYGGVTTMEPGDTVVITRDFTPGHYGLFCFTPDAKDGKPHFAHGMQRDFTVE